MPLILTAQAGTSLDTIGLSLRTALEGPQVVAEWNRIALSYDELRLLRRRDHEPQDHEDGFLVFSSVGRTETFIANDIWARPRTNYHYALFIKIEGVWYRPTDAVGECWSGARPALHPVLPGVTTTLASQLKCNATSVALTVAIADKGRWVRVGSGQNQYDILVLKASGANVSFEPPWDELGEEWAAGTTVTLLGSKKSLVADYIYGTAASPRVLQNDRTADQALDLLPATLANGEMVNLQQPGRQNFYERFSRVGLAHKAMAYEAAASLPLLTNPFESPLAMLRLAISRYGTVMPSGLRGWEQRTYYRIQPHLARMVGVEASLLKIMEIETGQVLTVRYGRDRTVKLNTPGQGIAGRGVGIFYAITSNTVTQSGSAPTANTEHVGCSMRLYNRATATSALATITAATPNFYTVSGGDPTALTFSYSGNRDASTKVWATPAAKIHVTTAGVFSRAGIAWGSDGWAVGAEFRVPASSVATSQLAGWWRVTVIAGDDMTCVPSNPGAAAMPPGNVDEDNIIMEGGLLSDALCCADNAFPTSGTGLVGALVAPSGEGNGSAGSFNGAPMTFEIIANNGRRVMTRGGNMLAIGTEGVEFSIRDKYQIELTIGGRLDRRLSLYNPKGACWNDNGLFVYVDDPLDADTLASTRAAVLGMRPSTRAIALVSDGGLTPAVQFILD